MASNPASYLEDFSIKPLRDSSFVYLKNYLVRVINLKSNCKTFDDLRYKMFKTKKKTLNELPPTSSIIHRHLLRSHYFVYLSWNILDSFSSILQHVKYEWIIENGLLLPTKNFAIPSDLTTNVIVRSDVQRIVDVGGQLMQGVLRLYKLQERTDFWDWFG